MKHFSCGIAIVTSLVFSACSEGYGGFTGARLGVLCDRTIPVCSVQAACVMDDASYAEGVFPGGLRTLLIHADERSLVTVRILFVGARAGGNELRVRVYETGCAGFDETRIADRDVLQTVGPTGIFETTLEMNGIGDHLLEIFSDAASSFVVTVQTERVTNDGP